MLYLGTTVLILFDLSYLSRFWTQFEAWLSMQFATPNGLKSAVGTKNARYHIVCIHAAAVQAELYRKVLVDTWANRTTQQAYNFLSKPDVKVTNESDKHSQLPKIKALNKTVQDAFQAVDVQLQQRVAARAEAAERAKAKLAAFERENGVKAAADNPLRKAAAQMEREAAAARAAQESHALAIAHGVMPNEEARAALEKDKRANATLESGMKESLEQRLLTTLHRDNGYWLEVAIEVPPAVFDASARDRAAVARLIKRLESDLVEREEDLRNRQHFPICITDVAHRDLDSDLEAGDVNILVWCGLGCDVANCAGSENAVNLKELKAKLSAKKKPGLVVVCMKYGARQVAEKLKGVGASIVWVEADVMSQNSNPERSSAPKKPLLAAVLAEVSSNLARSGSADGLIKEVEAAGGTAGMIVQGHENLPSQLKWTARPEAALIVPRVSRLPDTRTNIFANIFTSLTEENLKLLASDISRTKELLWEIADAVSKDKCPLKRCISSKEIVATITDKEADKEAVKAARYRVRAVALTACNAFMHGGTFEAVYRIDSDDTKETLKEIMESLSQVSSALIWLDLEEEAEDDLLAEIHRLMKLFSRDGKKGVFLLTTTPAHLPKTSFDVFQLETTHAIGGGKQQEQLKASDFYQEITFIMPVNILELLESHPKEVAEILNRILTDLFRKSHAIPSVFSSSFPSSLAGLYLGNAEQTVVARFCVSSVGFLHQLRDRVLDGTLVKMLSTELGKALKEAKGAAQATKLPLGMIAANMSKTLYNLFLSGNAQQEAASSESEMTIAVDLSLFADVYESSILQLDQLTPHQEEKMGDALRLLRGDETHIVHLTAPAGAGKTFVAQQIVLDLLKDLSRDGIILFSARTVPLCLFFVKWLVKRCLNSRNEVEDEQMIKTIVERVQVLHPPFEQGPLAVKLNEEKGDIEFVGVPEGGKVQSILLVVEDEAHHTYGDPELKLQVEKQILRWSPCQRLLLSDVSQSQGTEIAYPKDRKVVELTEVVRSSKRIITAANDFSLCGTKEKVPTCHHASEGPPLQTFLFDMQQKDEPRRDELYAEQTIAALQSVVTQFERLPLHDRLAIIVLDEGMRARLQEKLKARLTAAFPSRSFELVDAQRASRSYQKGVGSREWLVLDTIENMDGLERLMVIAVGLDSPIPENAEAAAEGDELRTRSTLQTRSHLYRALTRAHMLVCVVNETLPRGWLAYLTRLKLSKDGAFDEASALAERTAAEESVAIEKKRVTKCKEEAQAAVEAVAKKHSLGKEAVEWCSAMAAKKLMAGGAATSAAADAVCEWLIKPEIAAVEKMAAAQEMGLEAAEARAAVVRCVRSKLLESSARAPLKGGEGEGALAAVLAQWRRIGEELENALAAQEGLEGVDVTESMRMQVAVLAVVAKGGERKAAVVAEVQRRWMHMKEAAMMAEQEVKEEKLRAEVIRPAMAALLAGEAEELDKVACDWICADAVQRMEVGAGGSEVDGKMAVQAAAAAWRQLKAVRPITNLDDIDNDDAVREENYQIQKEQSVWDTKANLSVVVGGVLAFDPTSLLSDDTALNTSKGGEGTLKFSPFAVAIAHGVMPNEEARAALEKDNKLSRSPPSSKITRLVGAGTVIPDEKEGPYAVDSFHSNTIGKDRCYKNRGGEAAWHQENHERFAKETDWGTIDFETNGVDPDWMFSFGKIGGNAVQMWKLRPVVKRAQEAMAQEYGAAYVKARAPPGAAAALDRIEALEELAQKKASQPGGTSLTIIGLYKGALSSVERLWNFGMEAVKASGEEGVVLEWRIKKVRRIYFKLATKYKGDVSKVTDCAAISIVFASAEGLERAAAWVRARASTFKNRLKHPTDEGYRDLMFTVRMTDDHVCEVQLHLREMMHAKKSGAGHAMYKVCRRVLANPIVEENTYCRALDAYCRAQPVGDGERGADGKPEGRGVMVYASGDMYEGEWRAGKREGQGTVRYAIGDVYEGQYKADDKDGQGTFRYAIGDVYEGQYKAGKREGKGTFRYAIGDVYEGQYKADKREGQGTSRYINGDVYEGQYKADKREGKGTYRSATGDVYEGQWKADKREGKGTMTSATRGTKEGQWKAGNFVEASA
jgi:hypothetical protein